MTDTLKKVNWGIVGPGVIARTFAEELAYSRTGRLVAVASRSVDRARAFADDFGHHAGDIRAHKSYEDLLADPVVDAIYIATVHTSHVQIAIQALEGGKHVVCEKPLSVDHAGAMAVVEAARSCRRYLAEAYMYRFHPQTRRLVELIEGGVIGDVQHVDAAFSFNAELPAGHRLLDPTLAGGAILDVGGYPASVARLIAGAASGKLFEDPVSLNARGSIGATGVDEWATASLAFDSGITAHLTCGVRLADHNHVVVSGALGKIVVRAPWLPSTEHGSAIELRRVGCSPEPIRIEPAYQYALQADAVAEYAAEGQSPMMSWSDSLGNAFTLDQWRAAIGLQYQFEAPTAQIPPASGRAPARRTDAAVPTGRIPGIDKDVSRLILGVDNQTTLSHASVMFDDFVERGGNAFDTAHIYGDGSMERLLGQWIVNRGLRDQVVIVGKGAHTPYCDPESLVQQLEESLDRLQTDHVDLYLMHRDNPDIPVGEFVDVLDEQARLGRVRAFGVSNWSVARYQEALVYSKVRDKRRFAALSNNFGLAHPLELPWSGCVDVTGRGDREWLERTGTTLLPWSSQARGFFARADPDDRSDAELVACFYSEENFERLARARVLARDLGVTPTAVALAYVLAQPFPTFPLFGPRSIDETRTSMAGLEIELTDAQVRWLDLQGSTSPSLQPVAVS
jgi:aryl-alcohol dehydrogenase-like predicted oxidoreductase/predicted dehydrogenase